MEQDALRPAQDRAPHLDSEPAEIFETLARTAEAIAETEDNSAEVHDNAAAYLPGGPEHAARARRFADAERATASAYRKHEMPADYVRQAIRESRPGADDQESGESS
jgi:hypothetical protein